LQCNKIQQFDWRRGGYVCLQRGTAGAEPVGQASGINKPPTKYPADQKIIITAVRGLAPVGDPVQFRDIENRQRTAADLDQPGTLEFA
jgi:hypothetical protein